MALKGCGAVVSGRPGSRRISRRKPAEKIRLAAEKIVASRKPAEKKVRLSRRKIMRLVDKNYTQTVQLCFKYIKN